MRRAVMSMLLWLAAMPGQATELSEASRQALARSLVEQALAVEHGEGAVRDPEKAAQLYCDAARLGDAEAQYSLGWMYANGRGVARNESHAAALFSMAAGQGHAGAIKAQGVLGEGPQSAPECLKPKAASAEPTRQVSTAEILAQNEREDLSAYLASLPADRRRIAELITMLAPTYGIDPKLALAVSATESNFNIMARSPKGAMGVMQLIPETAARFGVKRPFEPGQNIRGGLSYLRWLLAYYEGDVLLAVAAYNAGEGAVDRNRGIPPYLETVAYVKRIYAFYRQPRHAFDAKLPDRSPLVRDARLAER